MSEPGVETEAGIAASLAANNVVASFGFVDGFSSFGQSYLRLGPEFFFRCLKKEPDQLVAAAVDFCLQGIGLFASVEAGDDC